MAPSLTLLPDGTVAEKKKGDAVSCATQVSESLRLVLPPQTRLTLKNSLTGSSDVSYPHHTIRPRETNKKDPEISTILQKTSNLLTNGGPRVSNTDHVKGFFHKTGPI